VFDVADTTAAKVTQMLAAILMFAAVMGVILFLAGLAKGRRSDRVVAYAYLAPTLLMVLFGLIYPGLRTIYQSFFDAAGKAFIGFDNYGTIFTDNDQLTVLRNTVFWVVVTPFVATAIGLVYAILVDKSRFESFAKALIFLPMSISFVAAVSAPTALAIRMAEQTGLTLVGFARRHSHVVYANPDRLS